MGSGVVEVVDGEGSSTGQVLAGWDGEEGKLGGSVKREAKEPKGSGRRLQGAGALGAKSKGTRYLGRRTRERAGAAPPPTSPSCCLPAFARDYLSRLSFNR